MGVVKERSFPRGGKKPSKSGKSKKIQLFDVRGKKKKQKKSKKLDKTPKEIITAEPLTYNSVTDGMLLLGCVIGTSDYYIRLSLPGRLVGRVTMANVSAPYTKILKSLLDKKTVDENYYELKNMFKVGQFVVAKVLTKTVSSDTGRHKLELTLDPGSVNVNHTHSSVKPGMVLHGAVKSVEDHGYMIDFGIKSLKAFLKTKGAQKYIEQWNDGRPLGVGQILPCLIQKADHSPSSSVLQVTADPVSTSCAVADADHELNIHTLTPGTQVKSLVAESIQDGFIIEFLNFKGFVYRDHTGDYNLKVSDIKHARVLYTLPLLNTVYLSIFLGTKDLLVAPREDLPGTPAVNKVIKNAKVMSASKKGVWVSLGNNEKCKGFILRRRLKDGEEVAPEKVKQLYPVGKEITVRIYRKDVMENIFICSAQKSEVTSDIYSPEDIKVGMKVNGKILELKEKGLDVKLGKNCQGFVPLSHFADFPLKYPEKRFSKGKEVEARVLKVNPEKGNVVLTLKQSLIKSELPIIASYEDAAKSTFADGVIVKIFDKGLILVFYNDVKGFVNISQTGCSSSDPKELREAYFVGQVVKCRIISCYPPKNKLILSLLLDEDKSSSFCSSEVISRIGRLYSLRVNEVTSKDLAVEVIGTKDKNESVMEGRKGVIPVLHLSDNASLAGSLLKTYSVGDEINSAVFHSVHSVNLQPLLIFSIRPAVLQFCSSFNEQKIVDKIESDESEAEDNEKIDDDIVTYKVKVGDVLPCSVVDVRQKILLLEAPIPKYGRKLIVFREGVANEIPEKIEDLGFVKNQLIFGKVIRKESEKKKLIVSTMLSNFWDGYDLEPSLELAKSYLSDLQLIRDRGKAAHLPLKKFSEGQKVEGTITSISSAGACLEVKPGKKKGTVVKAVVNPHHSKNKQIKVGDTVEGRVIFVDYSENQLHLTINPRIVDELEGIAGDTFVVGKGVRAEILLCCKDITVGIVKGLVHHGEFVYFPTKCHRNDFFSSPDSPDSLKPGEIIKAVIYGKVNGRMIAMKKKYVNLLCKYNEGKKIRKRKNSVNEDKPSVEENEVEEKRMKLVERKNGDVGMLETEVSAKKAKKKDTKEKVVDNSETDIASKKMKILDSVRKSESDESKEELLPRLEADQGFIWNADISSLPGLLPKLKDVVESSSEEEEVNEEVDTKGKKGKKKKERAALREEEEARIREAEERLMDADTAPQTADDYDRLVLSSPDSSIIWLKYVAFHLQNTEIEKARAVAQRALKTINFREEQEKLNVWVCLLNLENLYGTKESLEKVLQDALQMNDAYKVYCQMLQIYLDSKKIEELDDLMNAMLKKFRNQKEAWVQAGTICMKSNRPEMAGEILRRSFKSLPERDHVDVICRWAQLEARSECGSVERAQALLEGVLASCPRRTDIWSSLTDTLVKAGRIEDARNILERAVSQKLSVRKMKVLFKKFLTFEETHGTPENVARVRQLALDYVEKGIEEMS